MALRFVDGFDHYSIGQVLRKWTGNPVGPGTMQPGRFGGQCFEVANGGRGLSKTIDNQPTWVVGFAYRRAGLTAGICLALQDGGATQVDVRFNADGTISVTRNGTVLGTSTFSISLNTWYYIELKATIASGVGGSYDLHVNGVSRVSGSGVNTQNTANAFAAQVLIQNGSNSNEDFDDLYVCDGTGSAPYNTFLGDQRVETLYPTGAGVAAQFAVTGAASNYLAVNENPPNDDTSYVSSSTPTQQDLYTVGTLSSTPQSIAAVVTNLTARMDDAGPRSVADDIRSGGSNFGGATMALTSSYLDYQTIHTTDPPGTGAAWTQAGVQGAQYGVIEMA